MSERIAQQQQVGHDKPQHEDLCGRQSGNEQQLGVDKRHTPNRHYQKGSQMI